MQGLCPALTGDLCCSEAQFDVLLNQIKQVSLKVAQLEISMKGPVGLSIKHRSHWPFILLELRVRVDVGTWLHVSEKDRGLEVKKQEATSELDMGRNCSLKLSHFTNPVPASLIA